MYWANFLHFYQPPDQKKFIIDKVVNECYRPLLRILHHQPKSRLTMNINGCLLDKLEEAGAIDVIEGFRVLMSRGQVELTASVKYHPFLPLLQKSEIKRQIMINNDTLKKYFGEYFKPKGFFSPEAGYSRELALFIASLGYQWIIVDEIGYSGRLSVRSYDFSHTPGFYSGGLELHKIVGRITDTSKLKVNPSADGQKFVDYTKLYELQANSYSLSLPAGGSADGGSRSSRQVRTRKDDHHSSFYVFFRERIISDAIASGQIRTAEQFLKIIEPEMGKKRYLLTGTDGEAYGHHQPGLEGVLDDLLRRQALKSVTISELFRLFPILQAVDPVPSTWGTSEEDIEQKNYYSRWKDERNTIHLLQWELTNLAIEAVKKAKARKDKGYESARSLLDQALYSCHFWWAAARPWWSIEMIERGSKNLYDVFVALNSGAKVEKARARKLYIKIITTAFDWLRLELVWDLSHLHK